MPAPAFLIAALLLALVPGTGVIYTVSTGLFSGRRAALWAALGCTLGIVPHIAATALGLSALLHTGALTFRALRIAGALYLLYLAFGMAREANAPLPQAEAAPKRGLAIAGRGIALNLLNPKLTLFFFAFLPQFLDASAPTSPLVQLAVLGLAFMAITLAVFVLYGLAAAFARRRVLESPVILAWLRRGFAGAFALLGARLLCDDR